MIDRKETCETCEYYKEYHPMPPIGGCVFNAPSIGSQTDSHLGTNRTFPIVSALYDWCGQHAPKENQEGETP